MTELRMPERIKIESARRYFNFIKSVGESINLDIGDLLDIVRRRVIRAEGKEPQYNCKINKMELTNKN